MMENVSNEELVVNGVFRLKSKEDIKKRLLEECIDVPVQYIDEVADKVKDELSNPTEISDTSLDSVSGGASDWMRNNWGKVLSAVS